MYRSVNLAKKLKSLLHPRLFCTPLRPAPADPPALSVPLSPFSSASSSSAEPFCDPEDIVVRRKSFSSSSSTPSSLYRRSASLPPLRDASPPSRFSYATVQPAEPDAADRLWTELPATIIPLTLQSAQPGTAEPPGIPHPLSLPRELEGDEETGWRGVAEGEAKPFAAHPRMSAHHWAIAKNEWGIPWGELSSEIGETGETGEESEEGTVGTRETGETVEIMETGSELVPLGEESEGDIVEVGNFEMNSTRTRPEDRTQWTEDFIEDSIED